MVKKKGKSKRQTLNTKYKIQRKVVNTHRKQRKQSKKDAKNGVTTHHSKKKDPGIPNSWPFKQDLLNQIGRAKDLQKQRLQKQKEEKVNGLRMLNEHQMAGGTARTLEELMSRSARARDDFKAKGGDVANSQVDGVEKKESLGQSSRRAYLKELKKVVDHADVILQVLDARDPMGSRAGRAVEEHLLSHADKKMVLVLNKVDLVPKEAVSGWLTVLRRSHPTLAMKAATGSQGKSGGDVGRAKGENALKGNSAVGVEGLIMLLKNYCRVMDRKKGCITVGVIGYPNTGKSSIINSLKRARAVGVSPRPGFTTSMQEVVLDKNIRLLDSPGVVFDDDTSQSEDNSSVMLRNCVDADSITDPIAGVKAILARASMESLIMTYGIPAFPPGNEQMFLSMVCKKMGKVLKGGIPDKQSAARTILRDWNSGKVPFYVPPPTEDDGHKIGMEGSVKVVKAFGDAFDVTQMEEADKSVFNTLRDKDEMDFVQMAQEEGGRGDGANTVKALKGEDDDMPSSDEEDDDNNEQMDVDMEDQKQPSTRKVKSAASSNSKLAEAEDYDYANMM